MLGWATFAPRRVPGDQLVAAQLVQRLPHDGARHLEDVGDLLLGQLGARHQPSLDDGRVDRFDDAPRCALCRALRRAGTVGGDCAQNLLAAGACCRRRGGLTGRMTSSMCAERDMAAVK